MRVVLDAGYASMFDAYTYSVPDSLAQDVTPGACVLAPLGSREVIGYVAGYETSPPAIKTKDIISVVDSPVRLEPELFRLAQWLSSHYLSPLPRCLRAVLPKVLGSSVRTIVRELRVESLVLSNSIPDGLFHGPPDGPGLVDGPGRRRPGPSTSPGPSKRPSGHLTQYEEQALAALREAGGELTTQALKTRLRMASISKIVSGLEKKRLVEQITVPVVGQTRPRTIRAVGLACSLEEAEAAASASEKRAPKRAALLRYLSAAGTVPVAQALANCGITEAVVSGVAKQGLITISRMEVKRAPAFTSVAEQDIQLTYPQAQAVESICRAIDRGKTSTSLLFGVTASGKTEVYLRALGHALEKGLGAIMLLPEISLTTQVVDIFKSRFGDTVAVAHSYLSTGERFDEWRRINSGEARIVVGARSAIFSPIRNLGLVIIDEEHEPTYKQDNEPRYNARDAAIQRAHDDNAAVVLGSATPSIESYYKAQTGDYALLELPERALKQPLPSVSLVDMRKEYSKGLKSVFSEPLMEAIRKRIEAGEQIILFQNRRAYASFLLCRDCGKVMQCPNCAVALKYHRATKHVRCHHCNYTRAAPDLCPECQSRRFGGFGIGTEKVEEEMRKWFPEAAVLRMDRDTTSTRGSHAKILNAFRRKEAQVLIGTQMVAKGLDFPGVTLVGVISADTSVNLPDFRASERTFQLLSQVAGRAGRGSEPGEVIIQTFLPEHYAIQCALQHDYVGFYEQEIANRRELNYPPFSDLISIVSSDADAQVTQSRIRELAHLLRQEIAQAGLEIQLLGPAPCVIGRLRGDYRWQIVLKSARQQQASALLREFVIGRHAWKGITVDVDPAWML